MKLLIIILKSYVKSQVTAVMNQYPNNQDLKLDSALPFIPTGLHKALNTLYVGKNTRQYV